MFLRGVFVPLLSDRCHRRSDLKITGGDPPLDPPEFSTLSRVHGPRWERPMVEPLCLMLPLETAQRTRTLRGHQPFPGPQCAGEPGGQVVRSSDHHARERPGPWQAVGPRWVTLWSGNFKPVALAFLESPSHCYVTQTPVGRKEAPTSTTRTCSRFHPGA